MEREFFTEKETADFWDLVLAERSLQLLGEQEGVWKEAEAVAPRGVQVQVVSVVGHHLGPAAGARRRRPGKVLVEVLLVRASPARHAGRYHT